MKTKILLTVLSAGLLAGCASAQVTRTSANTMVIDAGAEASCGGQGAAKVAAKSAAIETIRAGYDRYIITGGHAQNNTSVSQMPGHFQTVGTSTNRRGYGTFNATSTYVPGATIVTGTYDRSLTVVMFRDGEPGSENALDARQELGAGWAELVESGIHNCL